MIEVQRFEALDAAKNQLSADSKVIGGGTLLMRQVNYGDQSFSRIIRILDPALKEISVASGQVNLGAQVTLDDIVARQELKFLHPVIKKIGGPAVRAMGTVGGNLFAKMPYGDLATALLALEATINWADGKQEPIVEFMKGRDNAHGIVRSVSFQQPQSGEFRYLKVTRTKPKGAALLSIAAWLKRDSGRLGDVRVAYGSMGPAPIRATAVEAALRGANLDENGIQNAVAKAVEGINPPDDSLSSGWYRREVMPVHLSRLLLNGGAS